MPDEIDALATRFGQVAPFEFNTSPLYQALGPVVAGDRALLETIAARRPGQQPTNLFFAALHHLVLRNDHPLREFFPSIAGSDVRPPDEAGPAMVDFCQRHRDDLALLLRTRLVQTNVVKRAAALRLGLSRVATSRDPAHLIEIGASSGIHLLHDRYRYRLGSYEYGDVSSPVTIEVEWRSRHPVVDLDQVPAMRRRIGIDLHPVDPSAPEDRSWLRALVWPENHHEAEMLEAALDIVAADPPEILEGDVVELASEVSAILPRGEPRVVFHAATRAHVPADRRLAFDEAVQSLADGAACFVISLEGPGRGDPKPSTFGPHHVLKVRGPDGETEIVALVEGHGDWIEPTS